MADQTSSSIVIDAPLATILEVIADVVAYPQWNSEITEVEVLESRPDGLPRRARFDISSIGLADQYVLDYDWSGDGVGWVLAEPSTLQKSQVGSYRLVAQGETCTEVHYDLRIESRIPMIGPMRRKIEKRIIDGALKELRSRVASLG